MRAGQSYIDVIPSVGWLAGFREGGCDHQTAPRSSFFTVTTLASAASQETSGYLGW